VNVLLTTNRTKR